VQLDPPGGAQRLRDHRGDDLAELRRDGVGEPDLRGDHGRAASIAPFREGQEPERREDRRQPEEGRDGDADGAARHASA